MKRVFRGKVKCDIGRRVVWLAVEQTESMRMSILRHEFNDIFGITGRHAGFRCILDIKFRLIGNLLPWLEWEWGVGEHQPNRLIIQNVGDGELRFYTFNGNRGYGRDLVCGVCRNAIGGIFPGLMETIGYYNACAVEVTGKIRGGDNPLANACIGGGKCAVPTERTPKAMNEEQVKATKAG